MFYDNIKKVCEQKGTNISAVLAAIGRATGNTGNWKIGKYPRVDIIMEMAEYLDVSTDLLLYGTEKDDNHVDLEWVEIIKHIPEDRQKMCKDFLRTHMVLPEKHADKKNA